MIDGCYRSLFPNLLTGVYYHYDYYHSSYSKVILCDIGDIEKLVQENSKFLYENYPYTKWHAYQFEVPIGPTYYMLRQRYSLIILEPLSMVIDPEGTFCMWKRPFIDRDLIIRGLRLFSTGKPTYKPIQLPKDGGYNFRIDVEDGNFFVSEKNSRGEYDRKPLFNGVEDVKKLPGVYGDKSLMLSSTDSEVLVGPKTAISKSDGEASSSNKLAKDALQSIGSDLDVFGQSLKFSWTDHRLDYKSTRTNESWFLGLSELKSLKCAGCVLCSPPTSGDKQLQLLSQSHNTVVQVHDDLLGFFLKNKIILDERSKSKKTKDRKNKKKLMLPDKVFVTPSNSTSLLKGTHSSSPARMRQISKVTASDSDFKELEILQSCVGLRNILVSLIWEDEHFYYAVTESYIYSLEDIISSPNHPLTGKMEDFFRDITNGLSSLHERGIVHGDLRPDNVKICQVSSAGSFAAKITGVTGRGSIAEDFTDLGHLSFFALTKGRFPLRDTLKKYATIETAKSDLDEEYPEAYDLIFSVLLCGDSSLTDAEVSNHPFFFNSQTVASFFMNTSEILQSEYNDENSRFLSNEMQMIRQRVFGMALDWGWKLNQGVFLTHEYYKGYRVDCTWSLILAIRNATAHPLRNEPDIKAVIGKSESEIGTYYRTQFPKLLIEVYKVMRKDCKNKDFRDIYFNW